MPKLSPLFHQPRIEAYDIAINALVTAVDGENHSYERRVEYSALAEKLAKEKAKFADKFGLNIEGAGNA